MSWGLWSDRLNVFDLEFFCVLEILGDIEICWEGGYRWGEWIIKGKGDEMIKILKDVKIILIG